MKFKLVENLNEAQIIFHPGTYVDDTTFVDELGNPYDLIPSNPAELARASKGGGEGERMEKDDSFDDDTPPEGTEEDEYFDVDSYNPALEQNDEDDTDFDPDEIEENPFMPPEEPKEPGEPSEPGKPEEPREPEDPKNPPDGPPPEIPKWPKKKKESDPPRNPKPPKYKLKVNPIQGKLLPDGTFQTVDGKIIRAGDPV